MMQDAAGGLRFTLDLPSPHEPRRFKVRPVAEGEAGAVEDLLRHAPGVSRHTPPAETPFAASVRLGAFDEMRVLRAFADLRLGAPTADGCFVELLVVDPRYRRAGLGAHLFGALAERLREAGARRVALEVDEGNDGAARFWSRLGFAETARLDERRAYEKRLV